jgi:hypothetical protein
VPLRPNEMLISCKPTREKPMVRVVGWRAGRERRPAQPAFVGGMSGLGGRRPKLLVRTSAVPKERATGRCCANRPRAGIGRLGRPSPGRPSPTLHADTRQSWSPPMLPSAGLHAFPSHPSGRRGEAETSTSDRRHRPMSARSLGLRLIRGKSMQAAGAVRLPPTMRARSDAGGIRRARAP